MSGVLFHHALELYLKGLLCANVAETERKKGLGHDLRRLWTRYKGLAGDADLTRFDATLAEVNRFEQVRYPDRVVEHGIRTAITFSRGEFYDQSTPRRSEPLYVVTVDEIDALAAELWKNSKLNPSAFTMRYKPATLSYLDQFNKSRFW